MFGWMKLASETSMLAVESNAVIHLRLTRFALGQGTQSEVHRMFVEKVFALAEAAGTAAIGGSADRILDAYRRRVRENIERLSA